MEMENSTTSVAHICLLDDNPISILTPILDPSISSDRLILAIKPSQKNAVEQLTKILKPRGINVSTWKLPEITNTREISNVFHKLISKELADNSSQQLVLNTSCGSRHSVLSAFEVAKHYKLHCFVVEPTFDELYWLYPTDKPNSPLADRLNNKDYLSALGIQVKEIANSDMVDTAVQDLGAKWCAKPNYYAQALGTLNYLAYSADNKSLTSIQLTNKQRKDTALSELINDLVSVKYIYLKKDAVVFKNNHARFFANGGWLEEYVYSVILSLKKDIPTIRDTAQGVEIVRDVNENSVTNELDVVTLTNNKLHIIECKTKKFKRGEGNNVIYKLDSLGDLLGDLYARAMLISFKDIRSSEQHRAEELNVKILGPQELPNLRTHLSIWLNKA